MFERLEYHASLLRSASIWATLIDSDFSEHIHGDNRDLGGLMYPTIISAYQRRNYSIRHIARQLWLFMDWYAKQYHFNVDILFVVMENECPSVWQTYGDILRQYQLFS